MDLISLRTKEALSAKRAQGQILGKPKDTLHKSKFDQNSRKIKELLGYGFSVRKIALNTYINKRERGLHQTVEARNPV
jgi:DNA invertase Pin-like site-specific DNA recombinase